MLHSRSPRESGASGGGAQLRLVAITAELHEYEGRINWKQPVRLGVEISGLGFIRICEQRGDCVRFDRDPLEAADLGEGGSIEVRDITDHVDPSLRGAEVAEPRLIHDGRGSPIGLALPRRRGGTLCLWVNDDEFYWGDEDALEAAQFPEDVCPTIGGEL